MITKDTAERIAKAVNDELGVELISVYIHREGAPLLLVKGGQAYLESTCPHALWLAARGHARRLTKEAA